jgi:hypothetical protein
VGGFIPEAAFEASARVLGAVVAVADVRVEREPRRVARNGSQRSISSTAIRCRCCGRKGGDKTLGRLQLDRVSRASCREPALRRPNLPKGGEPVGMPFDPSDEEERRRRRTALLARVCEELLSEIRAAGGPDAGWKINLLEARRRSLCEETRR